MIAQILIADDSSDIVMVLDEYLSGKGNRVIAASDGYQLAQKAEEHRPHLIITDIQMPGAYGSSAYQVLQKNGSTRNIPVIFMSAHSLTKLAPFFPRIPKPA